MRSRSVILLAIASCAPHRDAPLPLRDVSPPPATASAAPSPAPAAEPPPRPSRRGTCKLDRAVADYLLGQDAVQCGDAGRRPTLDENMKIRACILGAYREGRPFVAWYGGWSIDSELRGAIVARDDGDRLEVRWFFYDSCPSGCGDEDPHWWSLRCSELVLDLEAACKKLRAARPRAKGAPKQVRPEDEELRDICRIDEEGSIGLSWLSRHRFGLWCKAPTDERGCGAPLE
jgi:hypothetical protein